MSDVIHPQKVTHENIPLARIGRVEIWEQVLNNAVVDAMKVLDVERVVWVSHLERVWETLDPRIVSHKVDRLVVRYQLRDEGIFLDSGRSEIRANVDKCRQRPRDDSFEPLHTGSRRVRVGIENEASIRLRSRELGR